GLFRRRLSRSSRAFGCRPRARSAPPASLHQDLRAGVRCARGLLGSRSDGAHERRGARDIRSTEGSSGTRSGGGLSIARHGGFAFSFGFSLGFFSVFGGAGFASSGAAFLASSFSMNARRRFRRSSTVPS